jgi:cytochrome P450
MTSISTPTMRWPIRTSTTGPCETPISGFTRVATKAAEIGGTEVPAGARVLVSYSSANRDERHWDAPGVFDVSRDSGGQVGFGHGRHACAGMGLARLEAAAVLSALLERVERFALNGAPARRLNNLIRSFASVPVIVHPA